MSVGVIICLLRIKFCLSVGAFFERPRANTVRPYRGLGKYLVISPLILHALAGVFFITWEIERGLYANLLVQKSFPYAKTPDYRAFYS